MKFLKPPWNHQLEVVNLSAKVRDIGLFHDVGTGKTFSAINILRYRYATNKRLMRTLIVCPIVVLNNWQKEIQLFSRLTRDNIELLKGSGKKKAKQLTERAEISEEGFITIVNLDALLNKELMDAIKKWNPEILVLDESHMCKNPKAKKAKAVSRIADKTKHNIILTGTPILNSVEDVYMQYRILDRGEIFGRNFMNFKLKYMEDKNAAWKSNSNYFPDWKPRADMFDTLQKNMYMIAHRARKSDCLDLPPYIIKNIEVSLSAEQKRLYKEMKRDFVTFVESDHDQPKAVVAQLAVTKALRLQQIVTGFVKTDEGKEIIVKDNPRLRLLKEIIEPIVVENKVIVWAKFKQNHKDISKLLESMKIEHRLLNGSMTTKDKQQSIKDFMGDESVRVMVANQQAGGTGVNLQVASYSVYYSRDFNLAHDLQSEARNYRGGSEIHDKVTRINITASDTIDELITNALANKEDLSKTIIDRYKEI